MELSSVTAYDTGCAVFTYETFIETNGTKEQEFVLSDVRVPVCDNRVSVSIVDPTDTSDCFITDSSLKQRSVSEATYIKSGSQQLLELYKKLKEAIRAEAGQKQVVAQIQERSDVLSSLLKNIVDPKALSGKAGALFEMSTVKNLTQIMDEVRKAKYEDELNRIDEVEKLNSLSEEVAAIRDNFEKELGGGYHRFDTATPEEYLRSIDEIMNKPRTRQVHDIRILVTSGASTKVKLSIELLTRNVNWSPYYELRLSGDRLEKCEVNYLIKISQQTEVDWKDVPIHLASGDPRASQEPPQQPKMFVDIKKAEPPRPMMARKMMFAAAGAPNNAATECDAMAPPALFGCCAYETRSQFGNLKLTLPVGTEIKSNPEMSNIPITKFTLYGQLYHHIVCDHRKAAYRVVAIKNTSEWTIYNSSTAAVYLNNNMIGSIGIEDPIPQGASFVVYAGIDKFLQVTDLGDKDFKSKSGNMFVGNSHRKTAGVQLEITNSHPPGNYVDLVVSYGVPQSKNQAVTVTLGTDQQKAKTVAVSKDILAVNQNSAGGDLMNTKTGSYIQRKKVSAGETLQTSFLYMIDYPVNEDIEISRTY